MKIAVVCAHPTLLNPGMLSVDAAFDAVIAGLGSSPEVTRFSAEAAIPAEGAGHTYAHLTSVEQLEPFDRIVFWGDFLQWIGWATHDFLSREQVRRKGATATEIMDRWFSLFLLENAPGLRRRAIVFGSTLYPLNGTQIARPRYREALTALLKEARLVLMRDAMSANFVNQLSGRDGDLLGCDCALLMDSQAFAPAPDGTKEPYLAYGFGRSDGQLALAAFAENVARQAKVKSVRLNWFNRTGQRGLETKIGLIKGARYVLTDIYHLSITALREGRPTVCLGRGASYGETSLSDKKKEIFFAQHFLGQNYIFVESLFAALPTDSAVKSLTLRVLERLDDAAAAACARDMLSNRVARARGRLLEALAAD